MGTEVITGVFFQPLPTIVTTGGTVMHAIKVLDEHLPQFGECYFSTADGNQPKAWKKHSRMICNLFVPVGRVKFVFYDDRPESKDYQQMKEITISPAAYGRLVIHPGIWFGFSGLDVRGTSIILNVASVGHDPNESSRLEPGNGVIPYQWVF